MSRLAAVIGLAFTQLEPVVNIRRHVGLNNPPFPWTEAHQNG